jgi:hypothetical protein
MIVKDLKSYLDKLDSYTKRSIGLVEETSQLYGKYIDDPTSDHQLVNKLKPISNDIRELSLEVSNITIEDLAPDPFQDLDSLVIG